MNDNNYLAQLVQEACAGMIARETPTRRNANRNQRSDVAPDPKVLRAELESLLATGRHDLTIGYWRTSTIKQTDAYGREAQLQGIVALEQQQGIKTDLLIWDVDSGAEESRDGIDIVKEAIGSGQVGQVLCYKFDRISRDEFLSAEINKLSRSTKTRLLSATESIPEGPAGEVMRGVLQVFASYERLLIQARLVEGKRVSISRHGTYSGGNVPFGYRLVSQETNSGEANLIVDPWEATVVRLIFQLFERGYPFGTIAKWLNRQTLPTKFGSTRGWADVQVSRIIKSEAQYRSEALFSEKYKSEKVAHEAILQHRPSGDRPYLIDTVKRLPSGTQIPDDPLDEPIPRVKQGGTVATLKEADGRTLTLLYRLRDSGLSQEKCVHLLNDLGLKTMRGSTWKQTAVSMYDSRRREVEEEIARRGWAFEDLDVDAMAAEDRARREVGLNRERAAMRRIRQLRKLGYGIRRIAKTVNEEGHRTANDNLWHSSTISRALKGRSK